MFLTSWESQRTEMTVLYVSHRGRQSRCHLQYYQKHRSSSGCDSIHYFPSIHKLHTTELHRIFSASEKTHKILQQVTQISYNRCWGFLTDWLLEVLTMLTAEIYFSDRTLKPKYDYLGKAKETYLTSSSFLVRTEPTDEKAAEAFWLAWDRVSDVFLYL